MKRCPTCDQKLPEPPVERSRICWNCQRPIDSSHKYQIKVVGMLDKKASVFVHRHCDNPGSYLPKGAKAQ